MASSNIQNISSIMLPPVKNSSMMIDLKKGYRYNLGRDERFKESSSVTSIKANVPNAYLQNMNTFSESVNKSKSNLAKNERFTNTRVFNQDLDDLPSPSTYNLSYFKSIVAEAQPSKESKLRNNLGISKRYDRFTNKAYFKELDRGQGDQSPGPCTYISNVRPQLPDIRRSCSNLFGKSSRGLQLTKEEKASPSPQKYSVNYEFKGTRHVKGPTFGSAKKRFSMG